MPVDTTQATNGPATEQFRCTIKHMFRGCPKDDGWFGCFAHRHGDDDDIKLIGITNVPLADGMQLDVTALKKGEDYQENPYRSRVISCFLSRSYTNRRYVLR